MAPPSIFHHVRAGPPFVRSGIVRRSVSLSAGAKAGISLGCILGVAIVLCVAYPFIIRLWKKRTGIPDQPYHPSQDDPTHNGNLQPQTTELSRRMSLRSLEDQHAAGQDSAFDPNKVTLGSDPGKSCFDPRFPVPPHYRDHPDYLAHQAGLASVVAVTVAPSVPTIPQPIYHGMGAAPAHVPIEQTASRFGQLKENAFNTIAWSTDKAQFVKKVFKDIKRENEDCTSARKRSFLGDELDSPLARKSFHAWISPISNSQDVDSPVKPQGDASTPGFDQPVHTQPLTPAPTGFSPPMSPNHAIRDTFGELGQQDSTLLSGGKSGLPSPPLMDQATFDPKNLWSPTNQSERRHIVNHELVKLEEVKSEASAEVHMASISPLHEQQLHIPQLSMSLSPEPNSINPHVEPSLHFHPNSPSRDPTHLNPHLEPSLLFYRSSSSPDLNHVEPHPQQGLHYHPGSQTSKSSATPQPATAPQPHDAEMLDVASGFSMSNDMFTNGSNLEIPERRLTDSALSPASPMPNEHSYENHLSLAATTLSDSAATEVSNTGSPLVSLSTPSPAGRSSITSPRSYTCDECGKIFEQIHRLNHHKRYHDRKHECTVDGCNKKFGTKTHLDRHINDKHKKTRKFYCTEPTCPYSIQGGKSFPRKDNWVRHIRKKHRNLSLGQAEAQGFLIDEEAGIAHSVSAPPSQNTPQTTEIKYSLPMLMSTPMGHKVVSQPGMGGSMNNSMGDVVGPDMHRSMGNGMGISMSGMDGMNGMQDIHQRLVPPGAGFNSPWNMGYPNEY